MFKIAPTPTYVTPIKVVIPNEKGTNDTSTFKVEFKRRNTQELDSLREVEAELVLKENIVGFSDLLDAENKPLEFNETNLDALLQIPQARAALVIAFWETQYSAREKN